MRPTPHPGALVLSRDPDPFPWIEIQSVESGCCCCCWVSWVFLAYTKKNCVCVGGWCELVASILKSRDFIYRVDTRPLSKQWRVQQHPAHSAACQQRACPEEQLEQRLPPPAMACWLRCFSALPPGPSLTARLDGPRLSWGGGGPAQQLCSRVCSSPALPCRPFSAVHLKCRSVLTEPNAFICRPRLWFGKSSFCFLCF